MSTVVDIKDLLVTAGIGTFASTTGWSISISRAPDSPNQMVSIIWIGGPAPNPKFLFDQPSIQVMVRGAPEDYLATEAKAQDVKDALLGLPAQTINGTPYVGIWALGDTQFVGYDESERPTFTSNWRIRVEPTSGTNRVPISS